MNAEMGRVVLIFTAVLLLAGGAGYYFFKIYTPAKELEAAQREVTAWEARFQAARDCLLGKTPGSSKTSEALAIHEMAPDPWDRGRCTPLIGKLTRGEADDTGIPAVETAWSDLDKAAQTAAVAFATHVGNTARTRTTANDSLPGALDALDAARANLREAAKLAPTAQAGSALASAQIIPIVAGANQVSWVRMDSIPSAHGMVLFGATGGRDQTGAPVVQLTLTAGATPKVDRTQLASLRAVPDTSWGAIGGANTRIGAVDAEGNIAAPIAETSNGIVAAVIGSMKSGTVVAGNATDLSFARVRDSAVTVDPPIKITFAAADVDPDGRAVVLWETVDHKNRARIIVPTADGPTVDLPEPVNQACLTKGIAWGKGNSGTAYAFGGMAPPYQTDAMGMQLIGCTADAALFRDLGAPENVTICTDECRRAKLPSGAPAASTITIVDGNLVALASYNSVLGMWREGAPPAFFALGENVWSVVGQSQMAMAMTDGKVIDLIAERYKEGYVVVRIPAH